MALSDIFAELLIILILRHGVLACEDISVNWQRLFQYDNMKLTQYIIWTKTGLDKYQCMNACYKDHYCSYVNYDADSESECRAVNAPTEGISVSSTAAPGYQAYTTDKITYPAIGSPCSDSCGGADAECYAGICRCQIGLDTDGTTCRDITECTRFSGYYHHYHAKGLWAIGRYVYEGSWSAGTDSCNMDAACRGLTTLTSSPPQYITLLGTWLSYPESYRRYGNNGNGWWNVFQRKCLAWN